MQLAGVGERRGERGAGGGQPAVEREPTGDDTDRQARGGAVVPEACAVPPTPRSGEREGAVEAEVAVVRDVPAERPGEPGEDDAGAERERRRGAGRSAARLSVNEPWARARSDGSALDGWARRAIRSARTRAVLARGVSKTTRAGEMRSTARRRRAPGSASLMCRLPTCRGCRGGSWPLASVTPVEPASDPAPLIHGRAADPAEVDGKRGTVQWRREVVGLSGEAEVSRLHLAQDALTVEGGTPGSALPNHRSPVIVGFPSAATCSDPVPCRPVGPNETRRRRRRDRRRPPTRPRRSTAVAILRRVEAGADAGAVGGPVPSQPGPPKRHAADREVRHVALRRPSR